MMATEIDTILRNYTPGKRDQLIPLLQEIQEKTGFLSEDSIVEVGRYVGLSTTKIYSLATFYDEFRFLPAGKIQISVCNGTSCYLNGSKAVIDKLKEETGLLPGQTDRDGILSYEVVTCMGGCNHGPVICINGEYYTKVKAEQLPDMIRKLRYIVDNG